MSIFCGKVQREAVSACLNKVLVLKWVVVLAVRHGAGLEPAVEDGVVTLERALPLSRWDLQVVDEVPVQIVHLFARHHPTLATGPPPP